MVATLAVAVLLIAAQPAFAEELIRRRPYLPDVVESIPVSLPGTSPPALALTFDGLTVFESGADFLEIRDSQGAQIAGSPFTGTSLRDRTVRVPGALATLVLRTDATNPPGPELGFAITAVTAVPAARPEILSPAVLPPARVNVVYRQPLAASGIPPFTWQALEPAQLPAGLTLTADGLLIGLPLVPTLEPATLRVSVTDGRGQDSFTTLYLNVRR